MILLTSFTLLTFIACAQSLGPVQLFETPQTVAYPAPLSMGFFQARILAGKFPGSRVYMGDHFLFQEIFLIQGSNAHLLHRQVDSLPLIHLRSPGIC